MKKLKEFFGKLFAGKKEEEITPRDIKLKVLATAKNIYPSQRTETNASVFDTSFAILMDNEVESTAHKYSTAEVLPTSDELTQILSAQMKLAYGLASASESLGYIAAIQPIRAAVGQIFFLTKTETGLTIVSDAVQANAIGLTKLKNTVEEPVTVINLFNHPSSTNVNAVSEAATELGLNVVRNVIKEIVETVPSSKNIKTAIDEIYKGALRGSANVILVNAVSLELLKSHYKVNNAGRSQRGTPYIQEVGSITVGTQTLAVFQADDSSLDDKALVLYKGNNGQTDAGFFVSPYVSGGIDAHAECAYARVGTKFVYNGHSYYRTVPLTLKKKRVKKEESPVVTSP